MKIHIFLLALICLFSCKEDDIPYYGYAVLENGNKIVLDQKSGSLDIPVKTDISIGEVIPDEGSEWCTGVVKDGVITLTYTDNNGDYGREGSVLIRLGHHDLLLSIYQRSSGINHIEVENPIGDETLSWTATCSDEEVNDGGGVNMIFNDDQTKFWHSGYSPSLAPLPHWIIVDLKKEMDINQIRLGWRRYGDRYYVSTKRTEILVSTDGVNFTQTGGVIVREATEGSLSSEKYSPYTDCPFPTVKARYVKLNITESNASNGTCNVAYFKVFMP